MKVWCSLFVGFLYTCYATLNLLDPRVYNPIDGRSRGYHNNKRVTRPKRVILTECIAVQSCCNMGPADDRMYMLEKNCRRKLNVTGALSNEQIMCVNDCIAKNMGFMDSTGVINLDLLRGVLYRNLSSLHQWLDAQYINPILDVCVQTTENITEKCNGEMQQILHCVFFEAQSLCPQSHAANLKQCLLLLRYMEHHSSYPPRKYWC